MKSVPMPKKMETFWNWLSRGRELDLSFCAWYQRYLVENGTPDAYSHKSIREMHAFVNYCKRTFKKETKNRVTLSWNESALPWNSGAFREFAGIFGIASRYMQCVQPYQVCVD